MSAAVLTTAATAKLGRGAKRTHAFLLNQGGWWSLSELCRAFELSYPNGLLPQIRCLEAGRHIARKGSGVRGDPVCFGVTTACVPVPGVSLQTEDL